MATFPALSPSSIEASPGARPVVITNSYSGATSTTVPDTVLAVGGSLSLTFVGLTEAQANSIRDHCAGQAGDLFTFSTATLAAAFTPTGYAWTYADPAQVEDIRAVPGSEFYSVSCTFLSRRLRRAVPPSFTVELWLRTFPALALQLPPSFTATLDLTTTAGVLATPWVPPATDLWLESPTSNATWADRSGNGRDLSQATTTRRPVLNSTGLNGLPVLEFDSTDDQLLRGNAGAYGVNNCSIFVVMKYLSAGGADTPVGIGQFRTLYRDSGSSYQAFGTGGNDWTSTLDCDIGGAYHIWSVVQSGRDVTIARDGVAQSGQLPTTPSTLTDSQAYLGGFSTGFSSNVGIYAAIIIYGAVSAADRQRYEGYLADVAWRQQGVSVPLLSSHPYYSAAPTQ